ncbi:MAG: hypothetical protein ACP5KE_05420 [Candidatus Methanodesulfokora sp.]
MERVRKAKETLNKEIKPALCYALERDPRMASEIISKAFGEVLDLIAETDRSLAKRIEELSEADKKIANRIEELSNEVDRISRVVGTLASTVGRLDRRYSKLEEIELRGALENMCFSRGFEMDRGFIARGKPAVDALITGKGVVALVEIAMRGSSKDIRQLLRASKAYEEVNKVKPDALFLLCVEEPDELTVKRAEKKGVIVAMRPGEVIRTLEKLRKPAV